MDMCGDVPRCYHGQEQPSRAERSTPPYLSRRLCALTLFVLGDRRDNGYDSHCWGMLDEALVLGRVVLGPGEWDQ